MFDQTQWEEWADALAFAGNSLLAPMTQTSRVGLDLAFWENFPDFGSDAVSQAADSLALWAEGQSGRSEEEVVQAVSVEYTRLFVGPPSPVAPPWETMNRDAQCAVGFGEATFQMRELLREIGLSLSNASHQYEDHMGIELLYASELARIASEAEGERGELLSRQLSSFLKEHPLSWIDCFQGKVAVAARDGYYDRLLDMVRSLCTVVS